MKIIDFSFPLTEKIEDKITLCLGFFDGVHIGHKKLIEYAKSFGHKVGMLSFDNSPKIVLGQKKLNNYITSNADKAEIFEELGVDYFFLMHFDKETANLTKDEFIDGFIKVVDPIKIIVGEEYTFGARGEGNVKYLKNYFDIEEFPYVKIDGQKVSSRTIRNQLEIGNIKEANLFLGYPYRINGLVIEGRHRARTLNFPTANVELDYPYVFPAIGVYVGFAIYNGVRYKSIIVIGAHKDAIQLALPIIEVHLINYDGNLYNKDIFVEFIDRIRDMKQFDSDEQLMKQIEQDQITALKILEDL